MMKNNVCSGCGACEIICPKKCIKINKKNKKRFFRIIDKAVCVNCGLCEKVCPHNKSISLYDSIEAYNGFSKAPSVIERSSSGGIATEIYKYCIRQGILCVGVTLTKSGDLKYEFLTSEKRIRMAAGSKYAYSDMADIYEKVCSLLREDKQEIVFIGLPCHAYALRKYCETRGLETKKLTICDIVCHGVVMPYFYKRHINKKCNNKAEKIFFRKKDNPYGLVIYSNGQEVYSKTRNEDEYMLMFQNFILAESCRTCAFSNRQRTGDITIKDCSSPAEKRMLKIPMNQSSILINSDKGRELWKKINNNIISYQYSVEDICNEDIRLQGKYIKYKYEKLFWFLECFLGYKITAKIMLKK